MARMGKDGYSSSGRSQLSAKVPEGLKEDFKDACDARGESMTDVIESKMLEVVAEEVGLDDGRLPADDQLRDGYLALRQEADPDSGRIPCDTAETAVAEAAKVKSSAVRRRVLDPLERRGYIQYRWGVIRVREPEEVTSDDE